MIQKESNDKWIIKLVDFGVAINLNDQTEDEQKSQDFVGTPVK